MRTKGPMISETGFWGLILVLNLGAQVVLLSVME